MKPVDILEWTMGWAWPVLVVLAALMIWGIARVMTWNEGDGATQDRKADSLPGNACVCRCD